LTPCGCIQGVRTSGSKGDSVVVIPDAREDWGTSSDKAFRHTHEVIGSLAGAQAATLTRYLYCTVEGLTVLLSVLK
jgi:hypothetical protein